METKLTRKRVASEVRAARARKGITINELALRSGISRSALSRKLRADAPFTVDELLALSHVLDEEIRSFFPMERVA